MPELRKTKAEIVAALLAVGYRVTSNRREGKIEVQQGQPLALRRISIAVPADKQTKSTKQVIINEVKRTIGKAAYFDLIDHDLGHTDDDSNMVDAHIDFYSYTRD